MNELVAMETFLRLASAGSFSAAARQLGTSQGTVSRRIAELEEHLGSPLLRRTTRSVGLTDVGLAYQDACRLAVEAVERARAVALGDLVESGSLRVAVSLSYASAWLAPRLPEFLARWPDISVELVASNERVDLVAEGIDVAMRIGDARYAGAFARRLGVTRRVAVTSPRYLASRGEPDLETLEHHTVLLYGLGDSGASWDFEVDGRQRRFTPAARVMADSGDILRQIAVLDGGLAVLPDWMVAADLAAGRLVEVLTHVDFAQSQIRALWLNQAQPRGRVRAFIDWLVEAHG